MLKSYLKKLYEIASCGDAREESYYSCLEELLKEYTGSINRRNIHITTLPKKTEAGNPDFRVWDGKQHIIGYIEAKSPTTEYLQQIDSTEQLKRYRHTFPNLILTNFFEFRLYRNGSLIDKVLIGRPYVVFKLKTVPPAEKAGDFFNLLEKFFSFSFPKVYDAKTLAVELAKRTRFLKDGVITQELLDEERAGKGFILGFYEAFRQYLISGLKKEDFADLYSQTITYGLFAARTRTENGFNRRLAFEKIPRTIGILRDVFRFISLGDLPKQMEWAVDDISEVLAVTDVYKLLDEYFHKHKGKDPVVHFYETFLAEYDPKTREKRGVYYTPEPVVSYIVRSLHHILKGHFGKRDGFASDGVTVLDPAAGTLTFLAESAKLAVDEFVSKYGEGGKETLIKEHVLKNFYAFELMMAPYAVGHLKIGFLLEELGYRLKDDDRFKLYLTNTLEMEEPAQTEIPGVASLFEESYQAGKVKKEKPILVILGNPPYSGHSFNVGEWISKEIRAYYQVDGKPLKEKNPKWLQDDYVKFIRFAQWKIEQAGEGAIGLITNHSYLDNPTFRGMRQSLMSSFNEIYLLDLHGNSLKKEKCPDGSKDENVFDIQQGVAIALFVKKQEKKDEPIHPMFRPSPQMDVFVEDKIEEKPKKHKCKVYHAELWGIQKNKYEWLLKNNIKTTRWKKLTPKSEFHLYIPRDERLLKEYERYPKITDIFPVNSVGVVTARDNFVIDFDKEALKRRIKMFLNEKIPDEIIEQTFHLKDKSNWELKDAREKIRKDKDWQDLITRILYRPFDARWIFYHDALIERARKEVMRHMMQENLGLITIRRSRSLEDWRYAFVTDEIMAGATSITPLDINYLFPLYLYETAKKDNPHKRSFSTLMLLEPKADFYEKKPNLSPALIERLTKDYKKTPSPEQIFFYIYAVLYSNTYRTRYAEFLKIDFPRIPFTKDYKLFSKMAKYGERLAELHLMKSKESDKTAAKLQRKGDNKVEKVRYLGGLLYINQSQYFEGITSDIWQYQIGGYQVLEKWLKDRKGRILSLEEIRHYLQIVTAIQETIKIQKMIDALYSEVEKKPMDYNGNM